MPYGSSGRRPMAKKRAQRPSYDPLKERAKWLADVMWERAMAVADVLAPDVPADQEELPPQMQWLLLEKVAINLSPSAWDDPQAIEDLYRLRQQFAPQLAHDWMPTLARFRKKEKSLLPDPSVTPESPKFEAMKRRLARA